MNAITRPALRYYGGKWRIAPWIIRHFPAHHCYVEPFAGAASVLFRKAPAPFEVLNDLDGNVVNFFRVLREQTEDLKRAIEFTPFSREEVQLANEPTSDPMEQARRFYVRAWQTQHGAPYLGANGWRFGRRGGNDKRSAVDDWNDTRRLPAIAERLKNVQIEKDEASKAIARFDTKDTLFYCDPPYVASTRRDRWAGNGYRHELDEDDHRKLAEVLRSVAGMVVISGYPCELYQDLYRGWAVRSKQAYSRSACLKTEVLWLSPATVDRLGDRGLWE